MATTLINRSSLSLLFLTLAAVIQTLQANVAVYDDYWKQKAAAARKATLDSYVSQPFNVTDQLNSKVGESCKVLDAGANNRTSISTSTSTRRGLIIKKKGKRGGPCKATNPIDRCWRCDPNWANNRKKLADCALGFGRGTKGGRDGPIYVVTDASDTDMVNPKPGTLRHAVIQKGPLWIIFARSMIIRLNQELIMEGDKTIDARGAQVRIAYGAGITLQFIKNVIIHGVRFHNIVQGSGGMIRDSVDHYGFRTASDGDAISIYGSSKIWIDHISVSNCHDGVVDAIMGSTAITISNSQFTNHNEVMLFGGSDSYSDDQLMQITVAFNHFGRGLVQRMPRCRWGFFHVVNNDYTHWEMYAIGGSANPTILSQGNRFTAPHNPHAKEVTKRSAALGTWKNWIWRSEGDLMRNGAFFTESGDAKVVKKFSRHDVIKFKPGTYVTRLTRYSGSLDCFVGKPC